jgi:hypothetical protein
MAYMSRRKSAGVIALSAGAMAGPDAGAALEDAV